MFNRIMQRYRGMIYVPIAITFIFLLYIMRNSADSDTYKKQIYPYKENYHKYNANTKMYRVKLIADMDKKSKVMTSAKPLFRSSLLSGLLLRDPSSRSYSFSSDSSVELESKLNEAGRGMELSDLCYFNGILYSIDDRSGLVVEIRDDNVVVPRNILADGNGSKAKGFKAEWCTVKDNLLYIGGMGKEWTSAKGVIENYDPQWVKTIDINGAVKHLDWIQNFQALRKASSTLSPGYLLHEAAAWHPIKKKWFFLPRRVSTEIYDEELDEYRCGNIAIVASESFNEVDIVKNIGPLNKERGFSSVKFVPFRENELVVLKTTEVGSVASYIMVVDLDGNVLMPETYVGDVKYEGIEFV